MVGTVGAVRVVRAVSDGVKMGKRVRPQAEWDRALTQGRYRGFYLVTISRSSLNSVV